jgi:hypothetical protein
MNAKLSIDLTAYRDGTWSVATILRNYDDRGVGGVPAIVWSRVVDAPRVLELVVQAAQHVMASEQQRRDQRQVAAGERE